MSFQIFRANCHEHGSLLVCSCPDISLPHPQARNPHLTIATCGGAKVESHPIVLSPMSRTQSAVAPATPHSPPADAALPGTAEEQHDEVPVEEQEQSCQGDDALPTPVAADAPPEPAADQDAGDSREDAAAMDTTDDATELPTPPPAAADDAPTQVVGEEAAVQGAEPAQQEGGDEEGPADAGDDSESDPSTPVAVREALAAVHSLAISTGAVLLATLHEVTSMRGQVLVTTLAFLYLQSQITFEHRVANLTAHKLHLTRGQHAPKSGLFILTPSAGSVVDSNPYPISNPKPNPNATQPRALVMDVKPDPGLHRVSQAWWART